MKRLLFILSSVFVLTLFLMPQDAYARKIRVRSTGTAVAAGSYSSVSIYPSRLGIIINFFNLNKVSKVSYVLSYTGSGQSQGVVGSFAPPAATDSRELLFGTCSHGACRYHENVKTARLTLNFTLKNGGVSTKRYLIKVKK